MAKLSNSFKSKGQLDMDNVVIYEIKDKGKDSEYAEEVDLLGFLRSFDGKNISISITEDKEVYQAENVIEEEDEE